MIAINLDPQLKLTDEIFAQICRCNPNLRLERSAQGELIAMPPTGSESGRQSLGLSAQLWVWNQRTDFGVAFDSSTGFKLPNGAIRSPDAAWVKKERWQSLSPEQKRKFALICPDFVIELHSPMDELETLQQKLQEYIDNGTQLGWLVEPESRQVWIYRPQKKVEVCDRPNKLSGEPILSYFEMDFQLVWQD